MYAYRDLLEYEKQRAEDRAVAAENWRQKEGARAKQVSRLSGVLIGCRLRYMMESVLMSVPWFVAVWQAEEALEACRAELSTLREDLASVDNIIVKAERPHKVHWAFHIIDDHTQYAPFSATSFPL
jgi:hypothetical protein